MYSQKLHFYVESFADPVTRITVLLYLNIYHKVFCTSPATKNIPFSLAISEYLFVDSPGMGSAYSGKYSLPNGELQTS